MHDILDLDRYPLDRLDSPEGQALVATAGQSWQPTACSTLTGS